ncbi:hypothetical protein [Streptomyces sp. NPDC001980]|uniref:hypothetical protein n=1 Tax=Streptomyces sp. NPDC001980 TaxID=3157126 RepID=UPI00331E70A7
MSSIYGSDGRAAALLRQVPTASEIANWPHRARAASGAFQDAARVLTTTVHACAVDDRVECDDRYDMFDQVLVAAQRCGKDQYLSEPLQQIHSGKVSLAAWTAAQWARLLCDRNDRYRLRGLIGQVIDEVWRAGTALDLEVQGPPEGVRSACGQLARHIQHEGNVPDPAVAGIIAQLSRAYASTSHSTTAAHGIVAGALVDAGRSHDLVHEGTARYGPGVTFLGDALMLILHPPSS